MRRLALLVAFAAVLLPACGEENTPDGASPNGAGAGGGEVVEVSLSEFALTPASFSLEPGSYTFHVVNDGSVVHALEVEGPLGEVETADLAPGESADLDVDLSSPATTRCTAPSTATRTRAWRGRSRSVEAAGARRPPTTRRPTKTRATGTDDP